MIDPKLKEQQLLYDHTWREGLKSGKEQRGNLQTNLEFLEKIQVLKPTDKVLEVGCGIGSIVNYLTQKGYRNVIGTDISTEAIEYGKKKYPDIKLQVQAAEILPYDSEFFDVILSFDLFEHIKEVDKHISEVFRVLRPGGHYLFQTPNKCFNIIFETLSSMSLKWRRAHPSLHTPGQLTRRLRNHCFRVKFVKMNPINEFTIKKLKKFGPISYFFERLDFERLPMLLQTNLYVVAQKVP